MRGIARLEGKEPVGAVLTVGRKSSTGQPEHRDRFYIKLPDSTGKGREKEKGPHPDFAVFNNNPDLSRRTTINGVLVHAAVEECLEYHLKAQKLPAFKNHPLLPSCVGNGVQAKRLRLVGDEVNWDDIPCPNELCQYRQTDGKTRPPCGPWARFLFRPVWKPGVDGRASPLPTPLFKFVTQSWNTVSFLVGFFDHIKAQAGFVGIRNPLLWGMAFTLSLAEKTDGKEHRFPIVRISPTIDLQGFLIGQAERMAQLAAAPTYIALLDEPEQDPAVLLADKQRIEPGPMTQPRE